MSADASNGGPRELATSQPVKSARRRSESESVPMGPVTRTDKHLEGKEPDPDVARPSDDKFVLDTLLVF